MISDKEAQIIEYGRSNGKSLKEVQKAIAEMRKREGYQPAQTTTEQPTSTAMQRVRDVIDNAGSNVADAIQGDGEFAGRSSIRRGFEATAEAFKAVPGVAFAAAPEPVRNALGKVGQVYQKGMDAVTGFIGDRKVVQDFVTNNPNATRAIEETAGVLKAGGEISSTILLADQTAKAGNMAVNKAKDVAHSTTEAARNLYDDAVETGKTLRTRLQAKLGESSVDPQLKSSASRLQNGLTGAADRIDDPVTAYDSYLNQSKQAIDDIKLDPPISQVGEKIGNAFEKVVQQRRDIGTIMGEELKRVGDYRVHVDDAIKTFQDALDDSGLSVDVLSNKVRAGANSKLANQDIRLLNQYLDDVDRLGNHPSIAEIDAHLSRTKSMVDYAKSAQGMTSTTPGERLIKIAQDALRNKLTPDGSGLDDLATYAETRAMYAELSDFIDEGAGYLGKVTQSGDFAKDASIAKSAVQSILNNGKKDWLMKLEGLTDYNAMDDSVLALQAMKDAGDFRGLSLLQTMNDGVTPITPSGITQKVWDWTIEKGKEAIAGAPEEQTRAFLQSLAASPVDDVVVRAVNNHVSTSQQILQNIPPEQLSSMGGLAALLDRTKTNIVDGLTAQGKTAAAGAVTSVDPSQFNSLESFKQAVLKAIGGQ